MAIKKIKPFYPQWKYEGEGGDRSICKIYAYTGSQSIIEQFFAPSVDTLNSQTEPFVWGDGLLKSNATGQILDFQKYEVSTSGEYIDYREEMKENKQGAYYECTLETNPDSDSLQKWIQALNTYQRPTIFVIIYSNGKGRVIGNYNAGMSFSEKYRAGGRKKVQGREISYTWDSVHASYFLENTNAFIVDGYIRAKDLSNAYYSNVETGEAYFQGKFSETPYGFRYESGSLYFRVPKYTLITDSFFETGASDWEFEDNAGLISGFTNITSCLRGTSPTGTSKAWFKSLVFNLASDVLSNIHELTIEKIVIGSGNNNVIYDVRTFILDRCLTTGTSDNCMVSIPYFPRRATLQIAIGSAMTNSFHSSGLLTASFLWGHIDIYGTVTDCFNNSYWYFKDIRLYPGSNINGSFNNNYWKSEKTLLYTQSMATSFQGNQNVDIYLIETSNTASTAYISGYFDNSINLKIRDKVGVQVFAEGIGANGFSMCSGIFEFKTGYDTINMGGIEGDVALIISNGTPSSVSYNQ